MIIQLTKTRKYYDFDFPIKQDELDEDVEISAVIPDTLQVKGRAERLSDDKVNLEFTLSGELIYPCSRCLEPVKITVDDYHFQEELELENKNKLDLSLYINDCLFINEPYHILCKEDCKGLCPVCGTNLNDHQCSCEIEEPEDEIDPRLEKLKELL